jgi:hypothetical protein
VAALGTAFEQIFDRDEPLHLFIIARHPRVCTRADTTTKRSILRNIHEQYPGITLISVTQKIASVENYDQTSSLSRGHFYFALTGHFYLAATWSKYSEHLEGRI